GTPSRTPSTRSTRRGPPRPRGRCPRGARRRRCPEEPSARPTGCSGTGPRRPATGTRWRWRSRLQRTRVGAGPGYDVAPRTKGGTSVSGLIVTLIIAAGIALIIWGVFTWGRSKMGAIALIIAGLLVLPGGVSIWAWLK